MKNLTGAKIVIESLIQENVKVIFGYPGGAVLPIYDELFKQKKIKDIIVIMVMPPWDTHFRQQ